MSGGSKLYATAVTLKSGGTIRVSVLSKGSQEITLEEAALLSTEIFRTLSDPAGDFKIVEEEE